MPLTIEKVQFLNEVAKCNAEFPIIIDSNSSGFIPVTILNPRFGEFASTMNVYTNDPDNRMKVVSITGNFYSANELSFTGRVVNGEFFIDALLTNEEEITALQLDMVCPDGVSTNEDLLKLSDRTDGHSATLAKVDTNRYRLIIFSLKNASFKGNDGVIFSLGLTGKDLSGKQIKVENIKLSSVNGVNITTPNSEIKTEELPPAYEPGDVNGDGKVTSGDVVSLVNCIIGNKSSFFIDAVADVNGDGKISSGDVVSLVNIIINK